MIKDKRTTGKRGEDAACRYLEAAGHRILERGWRHSHQEVDIISLGPDMCVHIVEVKTRNAPTPVDPSVNVNREKQRNLVKAAAAYLHSKEFRALDIRDTELFFDVITVIFDGNDTILDYIPQAFIPMRV